MSTRTRFPKPFLFLILFLLVPMLAQAARLEDWSLEDVLDRVAEANGGKESIESITNVRIRGEIVGPENKVDFLLLKKRPNKMRIRLTHKKQAIEAGYNGIIGWRRISQGDNQQVLDVEGDDLFQLSLDADFDGPLVGPLQEGISRKLVGIERIDRVDYFIIEVSKPNMVSQHFVDSRTFRELKMVQRRTLENGEVLETTTTYADYRKFGGIWVAMLSERRLSTGVVETVQISSVDVNPAILDRAFNKPSN